MPSYRTDTATAHHVGCTGADCSHFTLTAETYNFTAERIAYFASLPILNPITKESAA